MSSTTIPFREHIDCLRISRRGSDGKGITRSSTRMGRVASSTATGCEAPSACAASVSGAWTDHRQSPSRSPAMPTITPASAGHASWGLRAMGPLVGVSLRREQCTGGVSELQENRYRVLDTGEGRTPQDLHGFSGRSVPKSAWNFALLVPKSA